MNYALTGIGFNLFILTEVYRWIFQAQQTLIIDDFTL